MAAYCALADLHEVVPEASVVQLTDDAQTGERDDTILAAALASAQAVIDSQLRTRYAGRFPLAEGETIPELVRVYTRDIWAWNIWTRRGELGVPDTVRDRHKDALRALERLADGKGSIGLESTTQAAGSYRSNKTSSDRVFGPEGMRGF